METGPFEKYDQLVSPDEEIHIEVTEVNRSGWPSELNGAYIAMETRNLTEWLLDHEWKIYRQTGHDGYEEIDHDV